jgi:hypothetical protein
MEFLSQEEERDTKRDYYLAQIACEVRRGYVKDPKKVKVDDFLVHFKKQGPKAKDSKSIWMGALGFKKKT